MFTAYVEVAFCAAHRIPGHAGKCKYLHGHNYLAGVEFARVSDGVDEMGFVIDFGPAKAAVKGWIDQYWDHNTILNHKDTLARLHEVVQFYGVSDADSLSVSKKVFGDKDPYLMSDNPTAECMALELYAKLARMFEKDGNIKVTSVTIQEQEHTAAKYTPE